MEFEPKNQPYVHKKTPGDRMKKMLAIIVLGLVCSLPALGATTARESGENPDLHKTLSMVGGGLLGVELASGAIGVLSASSMMYEGAAFADAMESGAGLSLPLTLLSAVLGGVFGQELVMRNLNALTGGESAR